MASHEAHPQVSAQLRVALLLFKNGRAIARTCGRMRTDRIVAWTRQALAQAAA